MVEFSVRIDFYRNLDKPPQDAGYVGSALRDGLHAVVLPRVGEYVHHLGPRAWRSGPYGDPYSVVETIEHHPTPAWQVNPARPEEERGPSVTLVVRAQWPGDGSLTGKPPGAGEQMLRDFDAQGGWRLHFFSDHAPVEPFSSQPLMRSVTGRIRDR